MVDLFINFKGKISKYSQQFPSLPISLVFGQISIFQEDCVAIVYELTLRDPLINRL